MSKVFSVHQRTCLISHTLAYVGAIRHSVTGPLKRVLEFTYIVTCTDLFHILKIFLSKIGPKTFDLNRTHLCNLLNL